MNALSSFSSSSSLPVVLKGHKGPVYCGSFDNSGVYALTGGHDKQIHLFNAQSGSLISTYTGHSWPVYDLSISNSGSILSGGGDKTVFVWDATAHRVIRKFTGHSQKINTVCWFGIEEGSLAISGADDRSARIWDLRSSGPFPIQILEEAQDSIMDIHVNGPNILTSSVDGHVRHYDIRAGRMISDPIGEPVTSVRFTKDRFAYLANSLDSKIRLVDTATGMTLNTYQGHLNEKYKIKATLLDNDAYILGGSESGEIFIWDLMSAKVVKKLALPTVVVKGQKQSDQSSTTPITSLASSEQGISILVGSFDGTSVIWSS